MHLGKFLRAVDDKGRLALPSAMRKDFGGSAFIAKSPGNDCVTLFLPEDFKDSLARLENLVRQGEATQNELRQFASSASEVQFDAQGRFRLPVDIRLAARIDQHAMVVGVGSRIEIWETKLWEKIENDTNSLKGERWL